MATPPPLNPQSKKRGCGKGCLIVGAIGFLAMILFPVLSNHLFKMQWESKRVNIVSSVRQAVDAGNYGKALSLAAPHSFHNDPELTALVAKAANGARQERIAGLVAEIKTAESDDQKAKLEQLLALDPNTKEFSEELAPVREKIKQREARMKRDPERQAEGARREQSRLVTQPLSGYQTKADPSVVSRAKRAVARELRDPDSAQFKDVGYAFSEKTGNVAFGWVNSKNGLGGYTGFQRFVADGTTVLLEEREQKRTLAAWREATAGRMTEQSLAKLSQARPASVPVVFDVKPIVSKTPSQVQKILGNPKATEKSKYGITYKYQSPDIEILFISGKANIITVNGLGSVPFSPTAIQALGLPPSNPSFANEQGLMRWESVAADKLPVIKYVQINRGQLNCEFATVAVEGWADEK